MGGDDTRTRDFWGGFTSFSIRASRCFFAKYCMILAPKRIEIENPQTHPELTVKCHSFPPATSTFSKGKNIALILPPQSFAFGEKTAKREKRVRERVKRVKEMARWNWRP